MIYKNHKNTKNNKEKIEIKNKNLVDKFSSYITYIFINANLKYKN